MENKRNIESAGECKTKRALVGAVWRDSIKSILFVVCLLDFFALSGCHGSDVFRGNGDGKNIAANIADTGDKNERLCFLESNRLGFR